MGACLYNPGSVNGLRAVRVPGTEQYIKIIRHDPTYYWVEHDHYLEKVMPLFTKHGVLGKGATAEVAHVIRKEDEQEFAMKIMKRAVSWNPWFFKQEYELLMTLSHPNILVYRDCYMDKENFYFCTELCKGGEVFGMVKRMKRFSEVETAMLMRSVISAIEYCHAMNIVHRDLKPENMMFRTKAQKEIVIIDFGEAKLIQEDEIFKDFVGTAGYLAPESIRNRTGADLKKSDMWAIGVISYMLLTGRPPFNGHDEQETLKEMISMPLLFPKNRKLSSTAKDFINKLMIKEPKDRMSAKDALNHKWLKEHAGTEDFGRELVESLSNYSGISKSKKILIRKLANQFNELDQSALRHQFNKIHTNGDGMINLEELSDFLVREGWNCKKAKKTANRIIKQLDQNGDENIYETEL